MGASASDIAEGLKLLEAKRRSIATRRRNSEIEKTEWKRVMRLVLSEHVGRAQRMPATRLTRLVAKRILPDLSDSELSALVDSRRKWIKEFLKQDGNKVGI